MKAFSLFAFLLLLTISAFSQILVGPVAGANYSWTSFSDKDLKDAYRLNPVVGYHVGGHLAFKVRKRFFLHTSVLYATKGRILEGKLDPELKNSVRYNYIDVPISYTVDFKGKIGKSKEFKYFVGIGPNVSYWLNGKGKLHYTDFEDNPQELHYKIVFKKLPEDQAADEMNVEKPNRLQLGLNLIAGLVVEPAPRQRIMVSIRYELGHSYLAKTNGIFQADTYFQDPLQSRNQGFRISLAYLVDLKVEDRKKGRSNIDKRKPK